MAKRILVGNGLINPDNIVEIEEKTVSLVVESGFLSNTKANFKVIIIKVVNAQNLYDFYTIYNDKKLITALKRDRKQTLEVGNFYCYPGIPQYPDYEETNMLYDASIKSRVDFMEKYM